MFKLAIATVLLVSGATKAADRSHTRLLLRAVLSARAASAGSVLLPLCELALAGALYATHSRLWLLVANGIFLLFTLYILRFADEGACGCFGGLVVDGPASLSIGRNIVLVGMGFAAAILTSTPAPWLPELALGIAVACLMLLAESLPSALTAARWGYRTPHP